MSAGRQIVYLIDAHSLIFQVFHAIPEMSSPSGLPTNALFGFTRDLLYLRTEKKPDYLLCVFDESGPTFRDKIYPQYKANRSAMPVDLPPQLAEMPKILEAMNIPMLRLAGYEADDLIATLAKTAGERGFDVFICSSDKDCRQLITERVKIFNLRKHQVFDEAELAKDWGIKPQQVIDLQTLVGDSVDNVPGVPGIGVKTAAKLLQDYGTLDNVLAHIDEIPGAKRQENLRAASEILELSRKLVRLDTGVPLTLDWENWRVRGWDANRLLELFREWGFHRFADQVRQLSSTVVPIEPKANGVKPKAVQGSLFDELSDEPPQEPFAETIDRAWDGKCELIDTPEALARLVKTLQAAPRIALVVIGSSELPRQGEIVGFACCLGAGDSSYVPTRIGGENTLPQLQPIFEAAGVRKVGHNLRLAIQLLQEQGVALNGVSGDAMVADYLLHAGERNHNIESLANNHLHRRLIPLSDLLGKGKDQSSIQQVAPQQMARYAGEAADACWQLCEKLECELEEQGTKRGMGILARPCTDESGKNAQPTGQTYLYDDLEIPLVEVLADLEYAGIRIDVALLQGMSGQMAEQLEGLEQQIHAIAGHPFNIASPKQLRQVLFDEMKLKRKRKTAIGGEASTDQETLEALAKEADSAAARTLIEKLLDYRKIAKLKGTYVDALPVLVNPKTGRVHASFNQTVAATGRLSSSDPNLQNVPIRSDLGGQIRQAFVPEIGWKLISADYSQIELRLLAEFSEDEQMRQAFVEDRDIHTMVAGQIFAVSEQAVTSEMRRMAKTVNFGIIYGMSAYGLAQRLEIEQDEAAKFIEAYFKQYPKVLHYQDWLLAECRKNQYVETILGRRRHITGIRGRTSYRQRNQPEREAINMAIQGSAADLIKMSMLNIHRRLRQEKRQARMLLQIHDELVFEAPPDEVPEVTALVHGEMTGALSDRLTVPLKVEVGVGPNWQELEFAG